MYLFLLGIFLQTPTINYGQYSKHLDYEYAKSRMGMGGLW